MKIFVIVQLSLITNMNSFYPPKKKVSSFYQNLDFSFHSIFIMIDWSYWTVTYLKKKSISTKNPEDK